MKTENTTVQAPSRIVAGVDVRKTALAKLTRGNPAIRDALEAWYSHDLDVAIAAGKAHSAYYESHIKPIGYPRPQEVTEEWNRLMEICHRADKAHNRSRKKWSAYANFWVIRTYDFQTDTWTVNPNFGKKEVAS